MTETTAIPDMTLRIANKPHTCGHCAWTARRDAGFPRFGNAVVLPETAYIEKGTEYAECYAYGDDPFHPGRYHKGCFEEMHS